MTKNDVEFWVTPVLPSKTTFQLKERLLNANDVYGLPGHSSGKLKTLCLSNQAEKMNFLIVISIMENSETEKPEVNFENNILSVLLNGKLRQLKYSDNSNLSNEPVFSIFKN